MEILLCFQWYSFMAVITRSYESFTINGMDHQTLPSSLFASLPYKLPPLFRAGPLGAKAIKETHPGAWAATAFSPAANRGVVWSDNATQAPRMLNSIRNQPEGVA